MNPVKTRFDPIGSVVSDSQIDDKLDRMFSLDSVGLTGTQSNYDDYYINEFNKSINIKNGNYEVSLPWTEKIEDVKSNFHISKAVLDRVVDKLNKDGLYDKYESFLNEQIKKGYSFFLAY